MPTMVESHVSSGVDSYRNWRSALVHARPCHRARLLGKAERPGSSSGSLVVHPVPGQEHGVRVHDVQRGDEIQLDGFAHGRHQLGHVPRGASPRPGGRHRFAGIAASDVGGPAAERVGARRVVAPSRENATTAVFPNSGGTSISVTPGVLRHAFSCDRRPLLTWRTSNLLTPATTRAWSSTQTHRRATPATRVRRGSRLSRVPSDSTSRACRERARVARPAFRLARRASTWMWARPRPPTISRVQRRRSSLLHDATRRAHSRSAPSSSLPRRYSRPRAPRRVPRDAQDGEHHPGARGLPGPGRSAARVDDPAAADEGRAVVRGAYGITLELRGGGDESDGGDEDPEPADPPGASRRRRLDRTIGRERETRAEGGANPAKFAPAAGERCAGDAFLGWP